MFSESTLNTFKIRTAFDLQLFKVMNLSQKALKFIIILAFGALKYCVKSYRERLNFHCFAVALD